MISHTKYKLIFLASFLMLAPVFLMAQNTKELSGAWQSKDGNRKTVLIFQDQYFTSSTYNDDEFISSFGGTYTSDKNAIDIHVEFNSENSDEVRKQLIAGVLFKGKELQFTVNNKTVTYQRIDASGAPLAGVWHITDRMQDGKIVPIMRSGTRKTLKVLTGTRFQWFAIDPAAKSFSGTGGGTYTFVDGKYTENIEFFSRDNSRVGAKLTFDGTLKDGKWHHSGLSSKGDKIYEVWSRTTVQ